MHFQYACYAHYIVDPCTKLLYIGSDITQQINDVINVLFEIVRFVHCFARTQIHFCLS